MFNDELDAKIHGVMAFTLWFGVLAFTLVYVYLLDVGTACSRSTRIEARGQRRDRRADRG